MKSARDVRQSTAWDLTSTLLVDTAPCRSVSHTSEAARMDLIMRAKGPVNRVVRSRSPKQMVSSSDGSIVRDEVREVMLRVAAASNAAMRTQKAVPTVSTTRAKRHGDDAVVS